MGLLDALGECQVGGLSNEGLWLLVGGRRKGKEEKKGRRSGGSDFGRRRL